jgi:hypothetical protein
MVWLYHEKNSKYGKTGFIKLSDLSSGREPERERPAGISDKRYLCNYS